MSIILDGKTVKREKAVLLADRIRAFREKPTLVILQVGNDERSTAYITQKRKFGEKIGAAVEVVQFAETIEENAVITAIHSFNNNDAVSGVILQLPIPSHLNRDTIINSIAASKDVDGLTARNQERFRKGDSQAVIPATARGVLSLLKHYALGIKGKKVAVLGRSKLVGSPVAILLEREGARVTVCHSKTKNVPEITRQNEIVVVAIGKPKLITAEYISPGAVVVDVGINIVTEEGVSTLEEEIPRKKLVGDVDFEHVALIAAAISPVPGGVGPMTVVSLFENLLDAHELQQRSKAR